MHTSEKCNIEASKHLQMHISEYISNIQIEGICIQINLYEIYKRNKAMILKISI